MSHPQDVFMEITNKDIWTQLQDFGKVQNEILEQTKRTNGRVTKLESTSIGMWIGGHPFQFTTYVAVFFSVVISDIRHPITDALTIFLQKIL